MFNNGFILPEACHKYKNLSFADVEKAYKSNQTIAGYVEEINAFKQLLTVRLGEDITATLPYGESTIYEFTYSKNNPSFPFPLQIASLREKLICVKVKEIDGQNITLSRKDNMLEAYKTIHRSSRLPFYVTSCKPCFVFGDIGQGITAKLGISDFCKARIRSMNEICKPGDSFFVKVINFDEFKRANVSYKDAFPPYNPDDYVPGEVITGRINDPVDDKFSGYFVDVSPQVVGILDCRPWHPFLNYGDFVECIVHRASKNGLRLRLSSVLKHSR